MGSGEGGGRKAEGEVGLAELGEGVGRELAATETVAGRGLLGVGDREGPLAPLVLRWRGGTAFLQAPALSAHSRETGARLGWGGARGGGREPRLVPLPGGLPRGPRGELRNLAVETPLKPGWTHQRVIEETAKTPIKDTGGGRTSPFIHETVPRARQVSVLTFHR